MGYGEGLNLKISEEPVQLKFSMPDRVKWYWRKSRSQHWGKSELVGQLILKTSLRNALCGAACRVLWWLGGLSHPATRLIYPYSLGFTCAASILHVSQPRSPRDYPSFRVFGQSQRFQLPLDLVHTLSDRESKAWSENRTGEA